MKQTIRNHRFRRPVRLVALCVILLGMAVASHAAAISGRAALWSYLRDDSVDHVQIVPLLSLTAHQIGSPTLSFETALRGYTDFRNGEANDEALRIHRAVLVYKPAKSKLLARFGQQWVSEGVARGNVLGAWGRYNFSKIFDLTAFGGSRLPNAVSLDETIPNEGYSLGLNARAHISKRDIGLSYYYVARGDEELYQGAGLDIACKAIPKFGWRARLHCNLLQSSIETAELTTLWYARDNVTVTLTGRNAAPRIFEDSFFAIFAEQSSNSSLRGSCRWTFYDDIYASATGTTIFSEADQLYKVRMGVGVPELEVGYTHWLSVDKGDMDGFYGQILSDLFSTFDMTAGFDYSRGSNSEIRPNTESQSVWTGFSWRPVRSFSITARGEHLKDVSHSEDWRALLSLSSNFSTLK